jgi:gluconolactonase
LRRYAGGVEQMGARGYVGQADGVSALGPVQQVQAVLERAHTLVEGPRIGAGGELIYSDVIAGGLFSCSTSGEVSELLAGRRGIGGIVAHADGGWVISGKTVLHLRPDGSQRELLAAEGACGYNDISSTPGGDLLAGELRYRPMVGQPPRPGRLLRLAPGGEPTVLSDRVTWPNGIGVSPDGLTVYISDYSDGTVLALALSGGGERVLCRSPQGSVDGLAVDARGGVWVALGEGGAVARFDAAGALQEIIDLPAQFVSSISFGGGDMRDVLISTADNQLMAETGGTLLRARSAIPGLPVAPVRV